jgi:hypothetical protein
MCSKAIVRILGLILMLAGVLVVVMGVMVATGSSWFSDLMPETNAAEAEAAEEFVSDLSNIGTAFEILIFVFGIYMLIMGLMACMFCGNSCEGKCCCVLLFQIFQIGLIFLTIVIAIMPISFWLIPNEDIEWFCGTG